MVRRRAELLVEKRDGQIQWLRATKLARSILLALEAEGEAEEWRALDLAATVLCGMRTIKGRRRRNLSTDEVATAVTEVLLGTGYPAAAAAYVSVASDRARRARSLAATGGSGEVAGVDRVGAAYAVPQDRATPDTLRN